MFFRDTLQNNLNLFHFIFLLKISSSKNVCINYYIIIVKVLIYRTYYKCCILPNKFMPKEKAISSLLYNWLPSDFIIVKSCATLTALTAEE